MVQKVKILRWISKVMISYKGLEKLPEEKGVKRSALTKEIGLSSRTVAKIARGEKLANGVIARLCTYFDCEPGDIFKVISTIKSCRYCATKT